MDKESHFTTDQDWTHQLDHHHAGSDYCVIELNYWRPNIRELYARP